MICPNCGANDINPEAVFCPNCGFKLRRTAEDIVNTTQKQKRKSNIVAGILALALGGFGAHRFYLGQIGLGILYILFCWTAIPSIIALIEGIIFLVNEDSFNAKYNS